MRLTNIIIFFVSNLAFSQFISQDVSNSNEEVQNVLIELTDKIQAGNAEDITQYIDMKSPPDYENFKIQSKALHEAISKKKLVINALKIINDDKPVFWIQRTIYKVKKNREKPVYQIYLELKKNRRLFYYFERRNKKRY